MAAWHLGVADCSTVRSDGPSRRAMASSGPLAGLKLAKPGVGTGCCVQVCGCGHARGVAVRNAALETSRGSGCGESASTGKTRLGSKCRCSGREVSAPPMLLGMYCTVLYCVCVAERHRAERA